MQEAQESLVKYQAVHGVVDVDGQARNDLNQLTNIDLQLMEKQILEKQYRVLYTPNHPLMVALKREIDIIKQKRSTIEAELAENWTQVKLILPHIHTSHLAFLV